MRAHENVTLLLSEFNYYPNGIIKGKGTAFESCYTPTNVLFVKNIIDTFIDKNISYIVAIISISNNY